MASFYGDWNGTSSDSLCLPERKEKKEKRKDKGKRKRKERKKKGNRYSLFSDLSFDSNTAGKGPAVPKYCT